MLIAPSLGVNNNHFYDTLLWIMRKIDLSIIGGFIKPPVG